ncbi:MAG TPA: hypothetical protein VGO47_08470 [Chlamydiales bacterium]|nr:hypothetical protein [Chlamydiales bacterium]
MSASFISSASHPPADLQPEIAGAPIQTVVEAVGPPVHPPGRPTEWGAIFEVPDHPLGPPVQYRAGRRIFVWLQDLRTSDFRQKYWWEEGKEIPLGEEDSLVQDGMSKAWLIDAILCRPILIYNIYKIGSGSGLGYFILERGDCFFGRNSWGTGLPHDDVLLAWVFDVWVFSPDNVVNNVN